LGRGSETTGDLLYILTTNGRWAVYYLDNSGDWQQHSTLSEDTNDIVESWQSFWVYRRAAGVDTNVAFAGRLFTSATPITFRSNEWHMIAWPFVDSRLENEGYGSTNKGWRFALDGGEKGGSSATADRLVYGEGSSMRVLLLRDDWRWHLLGDDDPVGSVSLEAGKSYYYNHQGTGFTWTAQEF